MAKIVIRDDISGGDLVITMRWDALDLYADVQLPSGRWLKRVVMRAGDTLRIADDAVIEAERDATRRAWLRTRHPDEEEPHGEDIWDLSGCEKCRAIGVS